jgi:hypothetical protein
MSEKQLPLIQTKLPFTELLCFQRLLVLHLRIPLLLTELLLSLLFLYACVCCWACYTGADSNSTSLFFPLISLPSATPCATHTTHSFFLGHCSLALQETGTKMMVITKHSSNVLIGAEMMSLDYGCKHSWLWNDALVHSQILQWSKKESRQNINVA